MTKGFPVHTPSLVGAGSPWHTVSILFYFLFIFKILPNWLKNQLKNK
jgi:hypothetical protein